MSTPFYSYSKPRYYEAARSAASEYLGFTAITDQMNHKKKI
jgi:hypothetical protein